jgi:hypothetical protein
MDDETMLAIVALRWGIEVYFKAGSHAGQGMFMT